MKVFNFTKILGVIAPALMSMSTTALENADVSISPSLFVESKAKPRIILSLDTSGSMTARAHAKKAYIHSEVYSGYFDASKCYKYNNTTGLEYFEATTNTRQAARNACTDANDWDGNFLNWLTTTRMDVVRDVLVGGRVRAQVNGTEYRRDAIPDKAKVNRYIKQTEEIVLTFGGAWTRRDFDSYAVARENADGTKQRNKEGKIITDKRSLNNISQVTPFKDKAKIWTCNGRILINKNGDNHGEYNFNKITKQMCNYQGDTQTYNNSIDNENGVAAFKVRVLVGTEEPTGMVQESQDKYSYGVAVYNYDHTSNADYRTAIGDKLRTPIFSQNLVDGGTLQPCYPNYDVAFTKREFNKADSITKNYDICKKTYAGAPINDLVDVIEYYPLTWGGTPMAEALLEVGGYIKQEAVPHFTDPKSSEDNYVLDRKSIWDPYYDKDIKNDTGGKGAMVPCVPVFVINLNDGAPVNDGQGTVFTGAGLKKLWKNGQAEYVDSTAWALRGDCRDDLEGNQDVRSFFVFADLSDVISNDEKRKMREASIVAYAKLRDDGPEPVAGAAKIKDFVFVDSPLMANAINDPNNTDSGLVSVSPQERKTWDKNGDGEPDNLFVATSSDAVRDAITRVLNEINKQVSSGTSVALTAKGQGGTGIVVQALVHASRYNEGLDQTVTWTGSLFAIFIDEENNLREDKDGDGILDDFSVDPIIKYITGDDNVRIQRYKADGIALDGEPIALKDLGVVWRGEDTLADLTDADAKVQRTAYSSADGKRYIFTADPTFKSAIPLINNVMTFDENSFDSVPYSWFGLSCDDDAAKIKCESDARSNMKAIVNYIRGDESKTVVDPTNPEQVRYRSRTLNNAGVEKRYLLGDIIGSSPLLVTGAKGALDEMGDGYDKFQLKYKDRRQVVYTGANDGMLHAFNAGFWDEATKTFSQGATGIAQHALGAELWAYVPINLWPHLQWLTLPDYQHVFYVNGEPQSFDVQIFDKNDADYPGGWGTILVVGLGVGGHSVIVDDAIDKNKKHKFSSSYVILDITNPEKPPRLLHEISTDELGFTTGLPAIARHSNSATEEDADNWYLVFGSGPTNLDDKTGADYKEGSGGLATSNQMANVYRYKLNGTSGNAAGAPDATVIAGDKAFMGSFTAVSWGDNDDVGSPDIDKRNTDDIFVGHNIGNDNGRLLRLHLDPASTTLEYSVFYDTGTAITAEPFVPKAMNKEDRIVLFGTGKLMVPGDNSISKQQHYYGLRVPEAVASPGAFIGTPVNTTNVRFTAGADYEKTAIPECSSCPGEYATLEKFKEYVSDAKGWVVDLHNGDDYIAGNPSGRNVGSSIGFNSTVFFTDYVPPYLACDEDGTTFLYGLDYFSGVQDYSVFDPAKEGEDFTPFIELDESYIPEVAASIDKDGNVDLVGLGDGKIISEGIEDRPEEPRAGREGRVSWRELIMDY